MNYKRIKTLRKMLGYTQKQFAKYISCSAANYSNKENNKTQWKLKECCILKNIINEQLSKKGNKSLTLEELFVSEQE